MMMGAIALGVATVPIVGRAASLRPTPQQTTGPYYPGHLELATLDNDLTRAPGANGLVQGLLIDLVGSVRDLSGAPVPGADVLIWQADAIGRYNHPADSGEGARDPHFEGAGVTRANDAGLYRFRTVKPAAYPPGGRRQRTPHIHMAVQTPAGESLVTQMYFPGEALNVDDGLFQRLGDEAPAVIAKMDRAQDDVARVSFDIVLGNQST
jgi:protocatechuate 3,4-dioxygenase beta subunit